MSRCKPWSVLSYTTVLCVALGSIAAAQEAAPEAAPTEESAPEPQAAPTAPPPAPKFAGALSLPLNCVVGDSCVLASLPDRLGPGRAADYHCGAMTHDGEQATSFAVVDRTLFLAGVAVRAAADGLVIAVRRGVPDQNALEEDPEVTRGKTLGNAVVIDHGRGLSTIYGHLRNGTIRIKEGDRVARGELLGEVGLSGRTAYPALHFEVHYAKRPVDPFLGITPPDACGLAAGSLWDEETRDAIRYAPAAVLGLGMHGVEPSLADARMGRATSPMLLNWSFKMYMWADVLGVQAGDKLALTLTQPDGRRRTVTQTFRQNQPEAFIKAQFARPGRLWPVGAYELRATLLRKGPDGRPIKVTRRQRLMGDAPNRIEVDGVSRTMLDMFGD